MRKQTLAVLVLAALAVALAAIGCGGSQDGGTVSTVAETNAEKPARDSSISKAALLARGDAVCAEGREKIAVAAPAALSADPAEREETEIELVSEVLVSVLRTDVEDLRALGAPKGEEEQVDAIVEGMQEVLETAEDEPEAFVVPQDPNVQRPDPWRKADKRAEEYGFKECPRS